ncbi:tetratricopeptide repeat protein [Pontibacter fetidus]|uniref:Tetratricopeptide repeat protein n=1 Tax=Pontibacter fetidus TaxID=2700082 RepID=A0A6B2H1J4_9BACT|nr:tetratricopeptide repeat protein [Pontibacter fetidus]NDK57149.1 tetratricopeptide repeat protein [Pontibacter fetidus]
MKILFTTLLFLFLMVFAFAQEAEERILYVVDSIPVTDEPEEGFSSLSEADIQEITVVTDKAAIEQYGYKDLDKVILITTKAYASRSSELKQIPSTKAMERIDGKWHLINSPTHYSGPFIDYFLNGKKQGEGNFKEGVVEGIRTVYYPDGKKNFQRNYSNGIENGEAEQYFPNGQLKYKGVFKDGKENGNWEEWYSTGNLKRLTEFKAGKTMPSKEQEKYHTLLSKANQQFREGNFQGSVKTLDKAIELDPNYTDAYFERGTAYFYDLKFDEAIKDYNKTLELEPLHMKALSNRAFARIRKYEFKGRRTLSKTNGVTVLASRGKAEIPREEQEQICADLKQGYQLGDKKQMIINAIKTYCK